MGADGKEIKLEAPTGDELPSKGFDPGKTPSVWLMPSWSDTHLLRLARLSHQLVQSGGVGDDAVLTAVSTSWLIEAHLKCLGSNMIGRISMSVICWMSFGCQAQDP